MGEPWIRVHAQLVNKPVVGRLTMALRVRPAAAVGYLVTLWGAVSQHAPGGILAAHSDEQLERWAGWDGKRGAFARWLRADHLDEDGRVREWTEYAGALERRRDAERDRVARYRAAQSTRDSTHAVRSTSSVHAANGTHDVRSTYGGTIRDERVVPPPQRARERVDLDPRLAAFLDAVPEAKRKAWRAIIAEWCTGERWGTTPRPTPDQVLDGLVAAVTAHDDGPLTERFVAGCIRKLGERPDPIAPTAEAKFSTVTD